MARPRQPIDLLEAKGKKHLTKKEKEDRKTSEVVPRTDEIIAPAYLTTSEKKQFNLLADQLKKIKIMGETDTEALARYITAQGLYEQAVKDLRKAQKERPKEADAHILIAWAELLEKLDKRVDRYYKQATSAASKLGLTITDRCRLVVPKSEEAPKVNKFNKFGEVNSA